MGAHTFARVPSINIPRSRFDRSSTHKTTFDSGYLIPFFSDEVLPGDTFDLTLSDFSRLSTPIVPVMDNMYMDTFFFFVPRRLVWNHWENMCGQQDNPFDGKEPKDFIVPMCKLNKVDTGDIFNIMGAPIGSYPTPLEFDDCYFRAYNRIWNEWFRDENLQEPVPFSMEDAPMDASSYKLLKRGKRKDYFTGCLPWPQKYTAPQITVGTGVAPVYGDGNALSLHSFMGNAACSYDSKPYVGSFSQKDGKLGISFVDNPSGCEGTPAFGSSGSRLSSSQTTVDFQDSFIGVPTKSLLGSNPSGLYADLTGGGLSPITINELREAFAVQRLLEDFARGGTRYTEVLRSSFRVISPDARLQRTEYLGGSHQYIHFNPVQQTSATVAGQTPQGHLAAFAQTSESKHIFSRSFTEHGIIIGLCCVYCDLNYQQGLEKRFQRKSIYEFYWPELANLGEQPVYESEIFCTGDPVNDKKVFGYQERWAEYRYKPNRISGAFSSTAPQSLDVWHLAQNFETAPSLNAAFIEENPPINRVLAVQNQPQFLFDAEFKLYCTRPMPLYSVPGLSGHF